MKLTLTFSEPPTVTLWCALIGAIADVCPAATLDPGGELAGGGFSWTIEVPGDVPAPA